MSVEAFLPCFVCGKKLQNAFIEADNQPYEANVFRTDGHYGATFWDSFDHEDIVVNICTPCLEAGKERIGQQKMYQPIWCAGLTGFGRKSVDRPVVAYTGSPDNSMAYVDEDELGTDIPGVEWVCDIAERVAALKEG